MQNLSSECSDCWRLELLRYQSVLSRMRLETAVHRWLDAIEMDLKSWEDQPRVPSGKSDGGQWTAGGGGSGGGASRGDGVYDSACSMPYRAKGILCDLLERDDIGGVIAMRHTGQAANVKGLKIDHLWE